MSLHLDRWLPIAGIIAIVALFQASSCRNRCCDCSGSTVFSWKVCEEDMPPPFDDWDAYRRALGESGCSCR